MNLFEGMVAASIVAKGTQAGYGPEVAVLQAARVVNELRSLPNDIRPLSPIESDGTKAAYLEIVRAIKAPEEAT